MTLKHSYNSTIAEDPASGTPGGLVGPNEWNADHSVSGTSLQTLFNNAGSLTGMSGTSWDNTNLALTITGATLTTSNPVLNLSQTWNAGGVTFTGLKFNVTNTASAAASEVFGFQVGGTDLFILQPNTNAILSLGDSTTATALRVYNTVDTLNNPTNYERGVFDWTTTANTLTIGTQAGGTGTVRNLRISVGSTATIDYNISSVNGWSIAAPTAILTIGSSTIIASVADFRIDSGHLFYWQARAVLASPADGVLKLFNNAETVFGQLAIDGTSNILAVANSTTAQGFRVYNTTDNTGASPTNYERGVFDWTTTANILTIGTQTGGTGSSRAVQFVGLDFVHGASVATNATDGFLYIPSCAGTPTGTPTTFTGTVPMVYDRTNNKFYIYNGGWKGGTNPGVFS